MTLNRQQGGYKLKAPQYYKNTFHTTTLMDLEQNQNNNDPVNPTSPTKSNNVFRHQSIKSKMSLESIISFPEQKNYPERISLQSDISAQQRKRLSQAPLLEQMCNEGENLVFNMISTRGTGSDVGFKTNRMSQQYNAEEHNPIQQSQNESSVIQHQMIIQQEQIVCKCLKSKCLLMYCQCFSKGLVCNDKCGCSQCRNNSQFEQKREKARQSVLQKDPNAFTNKLQLVGGQQTQLAHKRGCNCKKTHCFKKYCECFHAGVKCTYLCNCEGCYNGGQNASKQ